jgi:Tfp pilus assembly protein PilX
MKKLEQKGLGAVEGLLIIVILGLIAGVGWYVVQAKNKTVSNVNESNNSTSAKESAQEKAPEEYKRTATIPSDWKAYKNDKYKISFSYPSNWTISESLMNKKAGEDTQNVYSVNATEIFIICYKEAASAQTCATQINISNQPFSESLAQLRKYYTANHSPYKETELKIDGHKIVEFRTEARDGFPAEKSYYLDANNYTYGLVSVFESKPQKGSLQALSAADLLALFESIKVQ